MPHAGLELLEISSSSKDGRKFLTQRSERDLPRQGYRAVTARGTSNQAVVAIGQVHTREIELRCVGRI